MKISNMILIVHNYKGSAKCVCNLQHVQVKNKIYVIEIVFYMPYLILKNRLLKGLVAHKFRLQ